MKLLVAACGTHDEADESVMEAASFPWPQGSEIHILSVAEVIRPVMIDMVPDALDAGEVQVKTHGDGKIAATRRAAMRSRSFGI